MQRFLCRASALLGRLRPWLPLGLLLLAVGCSGPKSAEHAEVSGTVFYKGKPLPGGTVTFAAVKGGFAASGTILEDGKYTVNAPVGDVRIAVDNRALRRARGPAQPPVLKRPGAEEAHPIKGRYVDLPDKYLTPEDSGLTFKVEKGPQTHDVKLE